MEGHKLMVIMGVMLLNKRCYGFFYKAGGWNGQFIIAKDNLIPVTRTENR